MPLPDKSPNDRRYRYVVAPHLGGWCGYVGGMATDEVVPVSDRGSIIVFQSEALALRGAMDAILRMVHKDIVSHRAAIDELSERKPNAMTQLSKIFSEDGEKVFVRPGKAAKVDCKRRKPQNA